MDFYKIKRTSICKDGHAEFMTDHVDHDGFVWIIANKNHGFFSMSTGEVMTPLWSVNDTLVGFTDYIGE